MVFFLQLQSLYLKKARFITYSNLFDETKVLISFFEITEIIFILNGIIFCIGWLMNNYQIFI